MGDIFNKIREMREKYKIDYPREADELLDFMDSEIETTKKKLQAQLDLRAKDLDCVGRVGAENKTLKKEVEGYKKFLEGQGYTEIETKAQKDS